MVLPADAGKNTGFPGYDRLPAFRILALDGPATALMARSHAPGRRAAPLRPDGPSTNQIGADQPPAQVIGAGRALTATNAPGLGIKGRHLAAAGPTATPLLNPGCSEQSPSREAASFLVLAKELAKSDRAIVE
jgi:hypothetical protein